MAALALKRDPDVLQNRKMRKHSRNLERAHKPHPCNRGRTRPSDLAAIEENAPARRREEMGKQIEARRLTGTIWTDQRVDRPTPDRQIDVLRSEEHTSELQSRRDLVCRLLLEK